MILMVNSKNRKLAIVSVVLLILFSGCSAENEYRKAHEKFIGNRIESLSMKKDLILNLIENFEEEQKNGEEKEIIIYKWNVLLRYINLFIEETNITIDSMIVNDESIKYITLSRNCIGEINADFLANDVEMRLYIENQNFYDFEVLLDQLKTVFSNNYQEIHVNIEKYIDRIAR